MSSLELWKLSECIMDSLDEREIVERDSESREVEHLRHKASISKSDLIADAVLALRCRQYFLDRTGPFLNPLLAPGLLVMAKLLHKSDDAQVLERLHPRVDDLHQLSHQGSLEGVGRKQRSLLVCLLEVLHDSNALR